MGIRVLETLSTLAIRVVLLLLVLALAASEVAYAANPKDHWETTNISSDFLKNFINSKNCYKNENNFLGCVAALNSLLSTSTPKKILSNKKIENLPEMKDIIKTVQRVQIRNYVEVELDNANISQSWTKFKQTKEQINRSWKSIYALTKNTPLSFDILLENSLSLVSTDSLKAKLANSVNAYYGSAIDPHTYIISSSKWKESIASAEENSVGAGVYLRSFNDQIVLKPFDNSPAAKSGVLDLDILTHVDGKAVNAKNIDEALNMIRGKENTPVTLTVLRKGKSLDIKIVRSIFTIKNIESKLLTDPLTMKKLGYIKLNSFMEKGVSQKFINLAVELRKQGALVLILDLRNNGGGLVDEALSMASTYTKKDEIILTQNNPTTNKVMETFRSDGDADLYHLYRNTPLFILQNAYSASASEVLAGSLRVYGRAILVGEKSYGKGTVQAPFKIQNGPKEFFMMQTIARFHFASGASNQLVGLKADIQAYSKPNPTDDEKFAVREKDQYSNPIISSKAPTFPKNGVNTITRCIERRNFISTEYGNSAVGLDYQLLMAREAASCLM